jgi:hypothetical protein
MGIFLFALLIIREKLNNKFRYGLRIWEYLSLEFAKELKVLNKYLKSTKTKLRFNFDLYL